MLHVERLAERILFLGGGVDMIVGGEVQRIHDVKTMLETARGMEESSVKMYNQFANECLANADSASKKLFEDLVFDEERPYDQYDNEIDAMEKLGDRYLALQSTERSKGLAAGGTAD